MGSVPRSVTKIIGGKLVTVPEYRDSTSAQTTGHSVTYPWAKYDPVPSQKIGSRTYPVLPPISGGKFEICFETMSDLQPRMISFCWSQVFTVSNICL